MGLFVVIVYIGNHPWVVGCVLLLVPVLFKCTTFPETKWKFYLEGHELMVAQLQHVTTISSVGIFSSLPYPHGPWCWNTNMYIHVPQVPPTYLPSRSGPRSIQGVCLEIWYPKIHSFFILFSLNMAISGCTDRFQNHTRFKLMLVNFNPQFVSLYPLNTNI